jgi:hypothetical protein
MPNDGSIIQPALRVAIVDSHDEGRAPDVRTRATRDRVLIRRWAAARGAQPATGEQTASGAGTVDVRDGDAGVRFNFPGYARYRPISWDEWFENFDRYDLMFVYERDAPGEPLGHRWRLLTRANLPQQGALV